MGEMDSGNNSGSIQSSSGGGGDEHEFDSTLYNSSSMATFDNTMPFQLYSFNNGSSNSFYPTFSQSSPCSNFIINPNNTITTTIGSNNDNTSISDLGMVWPNKYTSSFDNNPTKCTTMDPVGPPTIPLPSSRAPPVSNESSDHPGPGGGGRNPKKRARASRRAPTTVLTTDTNNFRQMVQEFTGIPAQPFSGRTPLDLFGGLGMQLPRNGSLFETPPYLLRPFPQKVVPQHNNNPSMNNVPILVQPSTKSSNPTASASTGVRPNATGSLMNEFALGHFTTVTTAAATIGSGNMTIMSNVHNHQDHFPVQQRHGGSNANASALPGNHGGGTRSEGMVDSWICSSD